MPIPVHMQGSWTVEFKSRSAAWRQRVVIQGATVGNVTRELDGTPWSQAVSGDSWSVHVEHFDGTSWQSSHQRLKFPTLSGGLIQFDIETDDTAGDGDFNDLVLRCRTAQSAGDHVLYGSVSAYKGSCWYNPCARWPELVIDTYEGLERAWEIPVVADALVKLGAPRPVREQSAPKVARAFTPIAIPLASDRRIPPRRISTARSVTLDDGLRVVRERRTVSAELSSAPNLAIDRVKIAKLASQALRFCTTEKLAGYALRFVEYDRTLAESAGDAYSGQGDRATLGVAVTDAYGNYIYRFSRTAQEIGAEYTLDLAEGDNISVAGLPDVIAQVLAGGPGSASFYESYPKWNVGALQRIDLCFPWSAIPSPSTCEGVRNIQRLGDISTLETATNRWSPEGRITAHSTNIPGGWRAECASWEGSVEFIGCFSSEVARFAVRWRKSTDPAGEWRFFSGPERRLLIANLFNAGYAGDPIGPMNDLAAVYVTDTPTNGTNYSTYLNIARNNAWVASEWFRLFTLDTAALQALGGPGSYRIRVDGLSAAGAELGGDELTLYIDNDVVDVGLEQLDFAGLVAGTPGVCNLITLPTADAPLSIQFHAHEALGFLDSYSLSVGCCTPGGSWSVPVALDPGLPPTSFGAVSVSAGCDAMGNEGAPLGSQATAAPVTGDTWLRGQSFGVVTVSVTGTRRTTNGKNQGVRGTWRASASFGVRP